MQWVCQIPRYQRDLTDAGTPPEPVTACIVVGPSWGLTWDALPKLSTVEPIRLARERATVIPDQIGENAERVTVVMNA